MMSESSSRPSLPSIEFQEYCEAEFERRRNSGEEFDEDSYRAAMQSALELLRTLEEEEARR